MDEVLFVAESASGVLDPLNLGVQGFTGRVRDPVAQISHDVLKPSFQHSPRLDHWL